MSHLVQTKRGRPSSGKPRAKAYLLTWDEQQALTSLVEGSIKSKAASLDPDTIALTKVYAKLTQVRKK